MKRIAIALLSLVLFVPFFAHAEEDDSFLSISSGEGYYEEPDIYSEPEPTPDEAADLLDEPIAEEETSEAEVFEEVDEPQEAGEADAAQEASATDWPRQFVLTVGGDTTLGSTDNLRKRDDCFENVVFANGYDWPFSELHRIFGSDDLTLINFEGTLTESTNMKEKKFNFKGPAEYTQILTLGGVEAVNIANNHIVDYKDQGKEDTIAALNDAELIVSGGGILGYFEKDGVKVGMTGYCFPYKNGKKDISKDVKKLREAGCQIVIASFHWGIEYSEDFNGDQRRIGRAAINAGADLVVGHHPHVVQGIEKYKDKYILYSLGNLVFGGNVDPDDRDAYIAQLTFSVNEESTDAPYLQIIPIRLTALSDGTDYRPVFPEEADSDRILKKILRKSYKMEDY